MAQLSICLQLRSWSSIELGSLWGGCFCLCSSSHAHSLILALVLSLSNKILKIKTNIFTIRQFAIIRLFFGDSRNSSNKDLISQLEEKKVWSHHGIEENCFRFFSFLPLTLGDFFKKKNLPCQCCYIYSFCYFFNLIKKYIFL